MCLVCMVESGEPESGGQRNSQSALLTQRRRRKRDQTYWNSFESLTRASMSVPS